MLDKFKNIKTLIALETIHILPMIIISIVTIPYFKYISPFLYILFMLVFTANTTFSLYTLVEHKKGTFFYLLSIIFTLGFFVKFSSHTVFGHDYHQPLGYFIPSSESIAEVLWVSIVGALGFLCAQISLFFLKRPLIKKETLSKDYISIKYNVIFVMLVTVMSMINLKYNILLFGLVPSVDLPLKGNVIFFLALTRGSMFLLFFYFVRKIGFLSVLLGAVVTTVCSVGVLSRMITILYFATIFLYLIENIKNVKSINKLTYIIPLFAIFSMVTVKMSTNLRMDKYEGARPEDFKPLVKKKNSNISPVKMAPKYLQGFVYLATERWIGLEGVMAVVGYKEKGIELLIDGFRETGYKGKSFYSKISNPNYYNDFKKTNKTISTSVPGPIAFSYYSGSLFIVFTILFVSLLVCGVIENIVIAKVVDSRLASIYITVFMVFDFFQFGISPLAFIKYWSFTFFCLSAFLLTRGYIKEKGFFRHE